MNHNINSVIQAITSLKTQGKTPQEVMQIIMQQNPNYQQLMQRLQNMAQGRNPQEFIMQLARQNGVSEQNLQAMRDLFKNK